MTRILLLILLMIALFFGVYRTMRQVDWMGLLKVEQKANATEEKLGELLWKVLRRSDQEVTGELLVQSLDTILVRLCEANDIDRVNIKLHILEKEEINAFALPDGHLVVYSGLIAHAQNPEEIAGVMAHELAHIQLDHVMKRLVKEVGLSVLIATTTGSGGGELVKEMVRMLSSSAFDRKQEKEADLSAVDYMIKSGINPEPFADFMFRMRQKKGMGEEFMSWISTHPDAGERAEYILAYAKRQSNPTALYTNAPLLAADTWEEVQKGLEK
jgi:predicted Zn-dependent protease